MAYIESALESSSAHPVAPPHSVSAKWDHAAEHVPNPAGGLDDHLASGTVRIVRAREHVFTAGDPRTHVHRVESGAVCLYKIMPDGRRQVIEFAFPGDFIGLGCEAEYTLNAQALEPVRLKSIPAGTLARLAGRDPALGLRMYEAMSHELAAAQDHLFTIGQRSAAERVASFLLALSRRNARRDKDPTTIVLPMTRSDIADFLGLTIETVSRTFTKLRGAKIIDLEQCTLVRIADIGALQRLAGGETAV